MSPINCRKLSWLVVFAVGVLSILPLRFVSVSTVNVAFGPVIGHACVFAPFSISQACKPLLQTTWRPRLAWILGLSTRQLVHCTKRALMPLGGSWTWKRCGRRRADKLTSVPYTSMTHRRRHLSSTSACQCHVHRLQAFSSPIKRRPGFSALHVLMQDRLNTDL